MGGDEEAIASVTEPLGREVVLLKRIWDDKITRDHPELAGHLDAVLSAVIAPITSKPTLRPVEFATTGVVWAPAGGCWRS